MIADFLGFSVPFRAQAVVRCVTRSNQHQRVRSSTAVRHTRAPALQHLPWEVARAGASSCSLVDTAQVEGLTLRRWRPMPTEEVILPEISSPIELINGC